MCKTLIKTAPGIQGGGAALQRRGPPVHPWDGCRIFLLVKMFLEVFLAILFSYTDPIPTLYQVYTGLYRPYTGPIPTLYQSYTGLYGPYTAPLPTLYQSYTDLYRPYTDPIPSNIFVWGNLSRANKQPARLLSFRIQF